MTLAPVLRTSILRQRLINRLKREGKSESYIRGVLLVLDRARRSQMEATK